MRRSRKRLHLEGEGEGANDVGGRVTGAPAAGPARVSTVTTGVTRPETSESARPSTVSMRAVDPSPAGSTVNTTPARRAGTIAIITAAIATALSSTAKLLR